MAFFNNEKPKRVILFFPHSQQVENANTSMCRPQAFNSLLESLNRSSQGYEATEPCSARRSSQAMLAAWARGGT